MKRILRVLLLCTLSVFMILGFASCEVVFQQSQKEHVCAYSELNPGKLSELTSGSTHDFLLLGSETLSASEEEDLTNPEERWTYDRPNDAPFVKAYTMTYNLEVGERVIKLGKNVHIGICTHSASLGIDLSKVIFSENSGLYIFDCGEHGCYASLELATTLSKEYLDFAYLYARANGQTAVTLPGGYYGMNSGFSLLQYVSSGKLVAGDLENTTLCFNNFAAGYEEEIETLRNVGVTVHTVCKEPIADYTTHTCLYFPEVGMSTPVTQKSFYEIVTNLQYIPVDTQNPLKNFIFGHLAENICYDEKFEIPAGLTVGVCKNGFDFNVKETKGLYVFDCEPHACLCKDYQSAAPLWQDGLTVMSNYLAVLHEVNPSYPATKPLPNGAYALMEDLTEIPAAFVCSESVTFCLNGYNIKNEAQKLVLSDYVWDCTIPSEEGEILHTCSKLSPHTTAMTLEAFIKLSTENETFWDDMDEIAVVLTSDISVVEPIVVPKRKTVNVCLNGYSISTTRSLMMSSKPTIFFVEYTGTLNLVDCSEAKSSKLIALDENLLNSGDHANLTTTPIFNLGTCTVDGGSYFGYFGVFNSGTLFAKNAKFEGVNIGISTIEADSTDYPLHAKTLYTYVYNCEATGILSGISVTGDSSIAHSTVNSMYAGVVGGINLFGLSGLEDLNSVSLTSLPSTEIEDVTINLTTNIFPQYLNEETVNNLKVLLPSISGLVAIGDVELYGDLQIQAENQLLAPVPNEAGKLVYPVYNDLVLILSKCNLHGDAKLTDSYVVYFISNAGDDEPVVMANKDVSENFVLMEGYAGIINEAGEYVAVPSDQATFTNNAILQSCELNMEGYIRLDFVFLFDADSSAESFLNNANAKVKVLIDDEVIYVTPSEMQLRQDGTYFYSINLYAMNYRSNIRVQFTNGQYVWTGATNVSVETFLIQYLTAIEYTLADVEAILNPAEGVTYTEAEIQAAQQSKKELVAYKNVILSMLNYCDAAAVHFGVKDEYILLQSTFSAVRPVEDMEAEDPETKDPAVEEEPDLTTAMQKVTAEDLEAYKAVLMEGSTMPKGIRLLGMTLLLDSGTDIRIYFQIAETVDLDTVNFTVNGQTVSLIQYSEEVYYVKIANLAPLQIKTMYTISVTDGTASYTFQYGACSYLYNVLNNEESTEKLVYLAKALWLYADQMEKAINSLMETPDETEGENNGEVIENNENV